MPNRFSSGVYEISSTNGKVYNGVVIDETIISPSLSEHYHAGSSGASLAGLHCSVMVSGSVDGAETTGVRLQFRFKDDLGADIDLGYNTDNVGVFTAYDVANPKVGLINLHGSQSGASTTYFSSKLDLHFSQSDAGGYLFKLERSTLSDVALGADSKRVILMGKLFPGGGRIPKEVHIQGSTIPDADVNVDWRILKYSMSDDRSNPFGM